MIQKRIYKVKDSSRKGDRKEKEKKDYNNLNHPSIQEGSSYTGLASLD